MSHESMIERVRRDWLVVEGSLDERSRRHWVAARAESIGDGGITIVSRATEVSRDTIRAGIRELAQPADMSMLGRVRSPGAGRKRLIEADPGLMASLDALIESVKSPSTSPLRWTCKSTRTLADELSRSKRLMRDGGIRTRHVDGRTVAALLHDAGYNLRANRDTIDGGELPSRDAQFSFVNTEVMKFLRRQQPAICVDTGVWVPFGNRRNADLLGSGASPSDEGTVDHDPALDAVFPGGFPAAVDRRRWSSVGITHQTAQFAVAAVSRWWEAIGARRFRDADRLLIAADCGGRDDQRTRVWKAALQELADSIGMPLTIRHLPRGTCKWSNIEQTTLNFATNSRRGKLFAARQAIVCVIGRASYERPASVRVILDTVGHRRPAKVSDERFEGLNIEPAAFNEIWNYSCSPAKTSRRSKSRIGS